MSEIFVPVVSEKANLFGLKVQYDIDFCLNGIATGSTGHSQIKPLKEKLQKSLCKDKLQRHIKIRERISNQKLTSFDESTLSINLGIYLSLVASFEERKFSEEFETITVTGNFDVEENGSVKLVPVKLIQQKFDAVTELATERQNCNHLFIYVAKEEDCVIKNGWHKNIFVVSFNSSDSIENVFAEVFAKSEEVNRIIKNTLGSKLQDEYIQSTEFIDCKKLITKNNNCGVVISGQTNTGKSIAAAELCKYLIQTKNVQDIAWLTIFDNGNFFKKLNASNSGTFNLQKSSLIHSIFSEELKTVEELIKNKKRICLVIDNIEDENITDYILKFLEDFYKDAIDDGLLKIILTCWKVAPENQKLLNQLSLIELHPTLFNFNKDVFCKLIISMLKNLQLISIYNECTLELQNELVQLMYEQSFDDGEFCPGTVQVALTSIAQLGVEGFIKRFQKDDIRKLPKKTASLKVKFENLDIVSQLILFTYLGFNNYWDEIDQEKITSTINKIIFKNDVVGQNFISDVDFEISIKNLLSKKLLKSPNNKNFEVKSDVVNYCVFSESSTGEFCTHHILARDALIPIDVKIDLAIRYGLFEQFKKYILQFNDKEKINHFLIKCIEYNRSFDYLNLLAEKGIDPQYKDKDGNSAIDVTSCKPTKDDVFNFLIDLGFKPRKKIPCVDRKGNVFEYSQLVFACDECYLPRIKSILDMHLYEDLNDYEFNNKFTSLQLYAVAGKSAEALDLLIKAGADPYLKTKSGWTLLSCAVRNSEYPEIFDYIIQKKLYNDINEKNDDGSTALDYAKKIGNQRAVKILEEMIAKN